VLERCGCTDEAMEATTAQAVTEIASFGVWIGFLASRLEYHGLLEDELRQRRSEWALADLDTAQCDSMSVFLQ
jgi:hypothetical protein